MNDLWWLTHQYWNTTVSNNYFTQNKGFRDKGFFKELLMYFINNINIYQFNRFHELPWSRALFLPERKKMHNDKYVQLYEANSFRVIMRKASFAKMYTNTNWHFHDYNKWCLKSNLFVALMSKYYQTLYHSAEKYI